MDYKNFKGKYFGPNQIKEISLSKDKTYLGKDKVVITLEDKKEELPLEAVEAAVTDKPTDLTALREKRVIPTVEKIMVILVESELKNEDIGYAVGPKLQESINNALKMANKALWGKESYDLTLMDLEKVLKKQKHGESTKTKKGGVCSPENKS